MIEDRRPASGLQERLQKVEALYFDATTDGERGAADAAVEWLKAKLDEISRRDPPRAGISPVQVGTEGL
jgi:hypothetical protein